MLSFSAKNRSTEDKKAPVSSTVNVCANGSLFSTIVCWVIFVTFVISWVIFVTLITTGIGGGGGVLILTVVWTNSSTIPLVLYAVSAVLIDGVPANAIAFVELDVNLNVLVPFLNLNGGSGTARGSLKKKDPIVSPKVSLISLILDTVAIAPLVWPSNVIPFSILPKNLPCASSANDAISTLRTVADAEYPVGSVIDVLYGLFANVVDGEFISPVLWFGWQILQIISLSFEVTVSPDWKEPDTIVISTNFGIISIPLVPSKNG